MEPVGNVLNAPMNGLSSHPSSLKPVSATYRDGLEQGPYERAPRPYGPYRSTPGQWGNEMRHDAPICKMYVEEATRHDEGMLRGWNGSIDTLLIFAALFSAVVTAFLIESYKLMQPDFSELAFRVLSNSPIPPSTGPFIASNSARAVNCLWIVSLILSLFTSLVGILAKQWLVAYDLPPRESSYEWVLLRQFRFDGLRRWCMPEIVALLPVLLHVALLLFLAGLVAFFLHIDTVLTVVAAIASAVIYALYAVTTFAPLLSSSSPYRSQLTPWLRRIIRICADLLHLPAKQRLSQDGWHERSDMPAVVADLLAHAVSWLGTETQSHAAYRAVLTALSDMHDGLTVGRMVSESLRTKFSQTLRNVSAYALPLQDADRYFRAAVNIHAPDAWTILREPSPAAGAPLHNARFKEWYFAHLEDGMPDEMALLIILTGMDHLLDGTENECSDVMRAAVNGADVFRLIDTYSRHSNGYTAERALGVLLEMQQRRASRQQASPSHLSAFLHLAHVCRRHFLDSFPGSSQSQLAKLIYVSMPTAVQGRYDQYIATQPAPCCAVISLLCFLLISDYPDVQLMRDDATTQQLLDDLVFFCKGHTDAERTHPCILDVFEEPRYMTLRSWTCSGVALVVGTAEPTEPQGKADNLRFARLLATLLQREHAWLKREHERSFTLRQCGYSVRRLLDPATVDLNVLDVLLSDATLAPLASAPDVGLPDIFADILMMIAAALKRAHEKGDDVAALLAKFVASERRTPLRQWHITECFSQAFASLVNRKRPDPQRAIAFCAAVRALHDIDPSLPCWRAIAEKTHAELTRSRAGQNGSLMDGEDVSRAVQELSDQVRLSAPGERHPGKLGASSSPSL